MASTENKLNGSEAHVADEKEETSKTSGQNNSESVVSSTTPAERKCKLNKKKLFKFFFRKNLSGIVVIKKLNRPIL